MKRFARLYADGSINIDSGEAENLEQAKKRLGESKDDADTEIVEVEVKILKYYGKPKLEVIKQDAFKAALFEHADMTPELFDKISPILDDLKDEGFIYDR